MDHTFTSATYNDAIIAVEVRFDTDPVDCATHLIPCFSYGLCDVQEYDWHNISLNADSTEMTVMPKDPKSTLPPIVATANEIHKRSVWLEECYRAARDHLTPNEVDQLLQLWSNTTPEVWTAENVEGMLHNTIDEVAENRKFVVEARRLIPKMVSFIEMMSKTLESYTRQRELLARLAGVDLNHMEALATEMAERLAQGPTSCRTTGKGACDEDDDNDDSDEDNDDNRGSEDDRKHSWVV